MRFLLILTLFAFTSTLLTAQLVGETENGLASYYSNEYHGAETAYGEIYDKNELVAAHRLYPQNSVVKVRNMENNKSVNVRIIDKGPFIRGRIVELSERAAANIGMIGKQTAQVELTLLSTPDQPGRVAAKRTPVNSTPVPAAAAELRLEPEPVPELADREPEFSQPVPAPAAPPVERSTPTTPPPAAARPVAESTPAPTVIPETVARVKATAVSTKAYTRNSTFEPGIYKIELIKPAPGKFGVQVGSFKDMERAMDKVAEMQARWFDNILIERINTGPSTVYKIILGPFGTQKSASRYASDLKKRYKIDGFTVSI